MHTYIDIIICILSSVFPILFALSFYFSSFQLTTIKLGSQTSAKTSQPSLFGQRWLMDLLRWSTVSITALYTPKWMHIICIGRESNHKGRTHPKRGCLSYILYSSTLLISIRNNKRNDPFRADVNWNFTLYSWPPLLLLYFFFSFISFHLARQCVFLVVFFFSAAFVSFSFFAIAFSSPLTTIQQTIREGRGEKFVENSVWNTIYSLEQIPHVNTLEPEM